MKKEQARLQVETATLSTILEELPLEKAADVADVQA